MCQAALNQQHQSGYLAQHPSLASLSEIRIFSPPRLADCLENDETLETVLLELDDNFRPGVPFFYVSDSLGSLR